MDSRKKICSCGKAYWPNQAWSHEHHVPVSFNTGEFADRHVVTTVGNQYVTTPATIRNQKEVTCNQCVTKDEEIERLRNQIEKMRPKAPKRGRAEYMRKYRAEKNG